MSSGITGVLISSISKKVPLIASVRNALKRMGVSGRPVIGADADPRCIGKYFVDRFWEMPPLEALTAEQYIEYCRLHQVNRVIPTRDGELKFFASNQASFLKQGIRVMVSPGEAIDVCFDKLSFYQTLLKMGYPAIQTSPFIDELKCTSYVVKERYGAGASEIGINLTLEQARAHAKTLQHPIFQPYIQGKEISVDLYLSTTGAAKGVVAREREVVVNGESQVTQSLRNQALETLCKEMAEELKLAGHVMFQVIETVEQGTHFVIESNPRFGGASTLSIAMGLDSFYWFFQESQGVDLSKYPFKRATTEKRLIRYPRDLIVS